MNQNSLFATKKKLSVLFTILVFLIVSVLGTVFFTIKFLNISSQEKKDFSQTTNMFILEYKNNFERLKIILSQENKVFERIGKRPIDLKRWENEWLRFLNVIILNRFWEVTFQNISQNFDAEIDFTKFYKKNGVVNYEWNFIKTQKLPLSGETLIFIKKKWYDWDEFLQELLLFLLLCSVLSVWFYFVGLYFSGKILKPVEENISDMNDFIHNAWHELKTPLAVTSSNLQLLSQLKTYDPELVTSSIWEIKRMDQLIVWLSQLSDIQTFSHQEKFSLDDSIEQIISEYYSKIQNKNITVSKELEKVSFFWNKTYFEILFSNLLSNAIKYNQENWEIKISLTKKYLRIENTGNIITDEQKEKIFERFYRIETARSAEWFGIGLSLVKKICDIFSWKIRVRNTQSSNIFEIEL